MGNDRLKKSAIWYFIGAAVPMLLNFFKSPIFTSYYSTNDFGKFALINTTFAYVNIFAFSWALACVYRFYFHEKDGENLNALFTNITVLLFIGVLITTIISLILILFSNDLLIRKLILANCLNLIVTAITTFFFIILRLEGESFYYNILLISSSVLSFILLYFMAFQFDYSIDAMLNSSNIINGILTIFIIYICIKKYEFKKRYISKEVITKYMKYGFSSVLANVCLILLVSADRYAIQIFGSTSKVGIYNQIYNLAQISIVALITILDNIINPYKFKFLEKDVNNNDKFYKYIFIYIVCLLPFVIYFILYSQQIATLLLGEEFRIGYRMMPYIMISSFIYSLVNLHNDRLRFKNKLKKIIISVILASSLNILLNIILMPIFDYQIASITTLISYIFLYSLVIFADTSNILIDIPFFWAEFRRNAYIFLILGIQILIHYFIKIEFQLESISYSIFEGAIFLTIYLIVVFFRAKKTFKIESI